MRLIDADALIESLGLENAVKWGNKDGYQQDHSYSTMMLYEIKGAIDCMPTVNKWISVKDRLPDKTGKVMVYCADKYLAVVNYSAKHRQFCNYDECARRGEEWDVTHWMPLPEPPKEGDHDN